MTTIDPTQPPSAQPAPQPDMQTLIGNYWNAKHLADHWKAQEKEARLALANAMCASDDGYKNKTMNLGTHKLKLDVTREIKIDQRDPEFLAWWNDATTTVELKNKVMTIVPSTLKPSLSGYNGLDDAIKMRIAPAVRIAESLSIKFDPITDER